MGAIKQFEEIRAWQDARELTKLIYDLLDLASFRSDYDLRSQMRRAAGSIMNNIAEGFDAGSRTEFIRFLRYARRSAGEVQSQLYISLDRQYITENQFREAYTQATRIKKQINAFIAYLKRTRQPDNQTTRQPDNQTTRSPDHQITRSPDHQITMESSPPNHPQD